MRGNAILLVKWLASLGLVFSVTPFSFTQSRENDRIVGAIDDSSRATLQGNVRPMFRPENDMGPVEGSVKLENISLMSKPSESQQAALAALLAELQNPSSPNFHKWLTPEQYADRFGLSQSDIDQVVAWLEAQGFTVTRTARSRTWVSFSGNVAQVQAAFQTEIHKFSLHGETYYANATEPSVPSAFADMVLGIRALDNYRLKPHSVVRHVRAEPNPNFTSSITGGTLVAPGDFATIYDVNALYNIGIDGTGQSIAVMGQTDLYGGGSDITAFRSASGLLANPPQVIRIPDTTDPGVVSGDIDEASLDVEWSGAVAKNATIIFVNGGTNGVFNAFQYTIDENLAPVISISYGACEADWGSSNLNILAQLAQEANGQGQTIVAAAGESGAADCDSPTSPTSIVTMATHGLAVDAPASAPYVTGMGGSEFNEGSGAYWKTATSATGDILKSPLSYIPETVWNDTSSTNGLEASGGGASIYYSKPTWQTGTGVPNDSARDVPDLSLNASPNHDDYWYCVEGSCMNGFRAVSSNPNLNKAFTVAGGTSVGAATLAGIVALINQEMNTPKGQGNINPTLYSMATGTPAAFHDITNGNNIVPCQAGSPNCPASTPSQTGYSAGIGYDQASGLGSIDAFNLVTTWNSSSGTPDFTVVATPSTLFIFRGASGITTISISAINGFTGTVSLTCQVPSLMTGGGCSLAPASITPTSIATLTVYTTAPSRVIGPFNSPRWLVPIGGAIFAAFFLLVIPTKRRRLKLAFGTLFLVLLVAALVACGGSGISVTNPGTPLGIYTVTVTGTSGSLVRTVNVIVTVHSPE